MERVKKSTHIDTENMNFNYTSTEFHTIPPFWQFMTTIRFWPLFLYAIIDTKWLDDNVIAQYSKHSERKYNFRYKCHLAF